MTHRQQNVLLQFQVIQLLIINDYIFPNTLHSKDAPRMLILYHKYLPKGALSNDPLNVKIFDCHLVLIPRIECRASALSVSRELVGVEFESRRASELVEILLPSVGHGLNEIVFAFLRFFRFFT